MQVDKLESKSRLNFQIEFHAKYIFLLLHPTQLCNISMCICMQYKQIDCIIYQAVAKNRAEIPDLMGQKMPGISHHISESFFCHVKTMCKSIIFLRDILICVWNARNQSKSNGRERLRECFLFFTITASKAVLGIVQRNKRWQKYLYYTFMYRYVECSRYRLFFLGLTFVFKNLIHHITTLLCLSCIVYSLGGGSTSTQYILLQLWKEQQKSRKKYAGNVTPSVV